MNGLFDKHDFFADKASVPSRLAWGDPQKCPDPHVTVIMPVYRRPDFFAKALASVLQQDYTGAYEVVVVDNNQEPDSPNQTVVEQAADPRVLYYRNAENLGMYQNWNRGIELARAPYVTFCHDDDLLLPGALRILLQLAPAVGQACVLSAYHTIDENDRITGTTLQHKPHLGFIQPRKLVRYTRLGQYLGNVSCGDGCLYHRQSLLEAGGYDSDFYPAADYALHVAYAHFYGAWINPEPTACYRVADNESSKVYEAFPDAMKKVHLCMAARRGKPSRLLTRFIEAMYANNRDMSRRAWGGADKTGRTMTAGQRFLVGVARRLNAVNYYAFGRRSSV